LEEFQLFPIQGFLVAGDCTQTGEDGRMYNPNYLADYEHTYGLGTFESLPVQVYECTGNHDWDASEEIYPRMKGNYAYRNNPTVEMINRRNKNRYGITAQDGHGNYEWTWKTFGSGPYTFVGIALNVKIHTGDFEGLSHDHSSHSIEFLTQRVQVNTDPNIRFFILTHWISEKDISEINRVFGTRVSQIKAIFIGHAHVEKLFQFPATFLNTTFPIYILSSPDAGNDMAFFIYDTVSDALYPYNITPETNMNTIMIQENANANNQAQANIKTDLNLRLEKIPDAPKQFKEIDGSLYPVE